MSQILEARAIIARSPARYEVADVLVALPGPGEVRVKVLSSGVCASDIRAVVGSSRVAQYPTVLGHEGVGQVMDVGPGVQGVREGDVVVTLPYSPCTQCGPCRGGDAAGCRGRQRLRARDGLMADGGSRISSRDEPLRAYLGIGSLAELCVLSAQQVHVVPSGLSVEILTQLTCGTLTGLGAAWGTRAVYGAACVVVVGCGPVGRGVVQGARTAGAREIVAVDLLDERLAGAARAGATRLVRPPAPGRLPEDLLARADVSFEAVGSVMGFDSALAATGPRGTCVVVGGPPPGTILQVPSDSLFTGRTLVGAPNGNAVPARTLARALELHAAGTLALELADPCAAVPLDQVIPRALAGADCRYVSSAAQGGS